MGVNAPFDIARKFNPIAMGLNFLAISNGALTPIGELFFLSPLKWVVMLAPLGMVFYISAKLNSISAEKAFSAEILFNFAEI